MSDSFSLSCVLIMRRHLASPSMLAQACRFPCSALRSEAFSSTKHLSQVPFQHFYLFKPYECFAFSIFDNFSIFILNFSLIAVVALRLAEAGYVSTAVLPTRAGHVCKQAAHSLGASQRDMLIFICVSFLFPRRIAWQSDRKNTPTT